MDFMHECNSVPVDYVLTPLSADIGPYRKGQYWAEPDLQMAARQLRRAVDDPEWRQRLGQQARADVLARLAPQVVAEAIDARLSIITRRLAREPNPGSPG
jgi:hypothetical protein